VNAVAQLIQGPELHGNQARRGGMRQSLRHGLFPPKSQQLTQAVPIRLVQIGVRTLFHTPAAGA
jgi:hypothetical protein